MTTDYPRDSGSSDWEAEARTRSAAHLDESPAKPKTDLQLAFDSIRTILDEVEKKTFVAEVRVAPPTPSQKGRRDDRFNITVVYRYPPIPDRRWDWCAYYEGTEETGHYGEGSTPFMAIKDLIDNYNPTNYWESIK
jgi:hypothetical protein